MSGRDPMDVLAKAATKAKTPSDYVAARKAQAAVLAGLYRAVAELLKAGNVKKALPLANQAHALFEVLDALREQDTHPELRDESCEEKREGLDAWRSLLKPSRDTVRELDGHYSRRFAFVPRAPSPKFELPARKPEPYTGKIFETVLAPENTKRAEKLGLPVFLKFRHGDISHRGFTLSLFDAINRKLPKLKFENARANCRVISSDVPGNSEVQLDLIRYDAIPSDRDYETAYRVVATTHEDAAARLAKKRGSKISRTKPRTKRI